MNSSGSSVSASMARATWRRSRGSSARRRRCSTTARAKRLGEAPLGQHHLDRRAAPGLAGEVLGHQRQLDRHAGPDDGRRSRGSSVPRPAWDRRAAGAAPVPAAARAAGARPFLGARPRPGGRGLVLLRPHAPDAGLGGDHAVVVLDLVEQLEGAARALLGVLGERDLGGMIGDHLERPARAAGCRQPIPSRCPTCAPRP